MSPRDGRAAGVSYRRAEVQSGGGRRRRRRRGNEMKEVRQRYFISNGHKLEN